MEIRLARPTLDLEYIPNDKLCKRNLDRCLIRNSHQERCFRYQPFHRLGIRTEWDELCQLRYTLCKQRLSSIALHHSCHATVGFILGWINLTSQFIHLFSNWVRCAKKLVVGVAIIFVVGHLGSANIWQYHCLFGNLLRR